MTFSSEGCRLVRELKRGMSWKVRLGCLTDYGIHEMTFGNYLSTLFLLRFPSCMICLVSFLLLSTLVTNNIELIYNPVPVTFNES